MKTSLGQPIVFENATGAGGTIATARAMRAAPDGYTLSLGNLGSHVVSPATYPNIQYHPLNDFEPVALLGTSAYWLVAKKTLPPVPSATEAGLPDLTITFWIGLWAPKGTPKDVIARINAAVGAAGADPAIRQRLRDQGVEPAIPSLQTPEAFGAFHKKWWPFIKTANIKAE